MEEYMRKVPVTGRTSKGEIVIYQTQDKKIQIDVRFEKETIWLTQAQIAKLFRADRSVIGRHIAKIFTSKELEEKSNVQKMHIPFSDRPVKLYNLFVDGNKRIAAALFVCFLDKNGLLFDRAGRRRLDTNALVALTLLVAASKPSEKDVMIRVILNLLA
ncbi:MAG: hypothetical protein PHT59_01805 [Candidatus Omnitrophica bacterium]|nr:hypothetical protein [Candidatus Omnitrophota bacterium]